MPAHDGLWLHEDEHVCPICPDASECRPKQPVNPIQLWARALALEHRYLLPEGEDLDSGVTPRAKEHSEGGQKSADEFEHEFYVVTYLAQLVDYADSWTFGDTQGPTINWN